MNLSLRRRQGQHGGNDNRRPSNPTSNSAGVQDRKNIISMITTDSGEVSLREGDGKGGR